MANRYLTTARDFVSALGKLPQATRVANAVQTGNQPNRCDLKSLGIEDSFPFK